LASRGGKMSVWRETSVEEWLEGLQGREKVERRW